MKTKVSIKNLNWFVAFWLTEKSISFPIERFRLARTRLVWLLVRLLLELIDVDLSLAHFRQRMTPGTRWFARSARRWTKTMSTLWSVLYLVDQFFYLGIAPRERIVDYDVEIRLKPDSSLLNHFRVLISFFPEMSFWELRKFKLP